MLKSSALSATISVVIWIVISAITGGSAAFVILGGIVCGLVVFVLGYGFRRLIFHR
jgi:hypothetical protein